MKIIIERYSHLYSAPLYKNHNKEWQSDYKLLMDDQKEVTIDLNAITSFLSVGQFSKNRTLFNEIKRLPWLSEPLPNGNYKEIELPKHGFKTGNDSELANILFKKLLNEARDVISKNSNIYILLTGGLDSRLIAGIYNYLYLNGELKVKPKCLTWGLKDSRDVYYAKIMADSLKLEWTHIPLEPETVINNIKKCGEYLGMLHSPEMLHSMLWFKNLPSDAIVVAGSFGDSIGRGEFSSLHLLQLDHKQPANTYDLLKPSAFNFGAKGLSEDLDYIHNRGGDTTLEYVQCEYWMQGYRMRNGLCHALSVINRFANVYQMFTAPEVYSFVWSLHPSRRDDNIYIALLKNQFPELAKIPWARNNEAIGGNYKNQKLRAHYHDYTKWSSGVLYNDIRALVDPEWFASTGIFDGNSIINLNQMVLKSKERVGRLNDIWLWLAGFRYYIDDLESQGKIINYGKYDEDVVKNQERNESKLKNSLVLIASKSKLINTTAKKIRDKYREIDLASRKKEMLRKHPPEVYET